MIPVAFDPTPPERQSPHVNPSAADERSRDYFNHTKSSNSSKKTSGVRHGDLADREEPEQPQEIPSPHIAYQEKGRSSANDDSSKGATRQVSGSDNSTAAVSPSTSLDRIRQQTVVSPSAQKSHNERGSEEKFKLQDVPKGRNSRQNSKTEGAPTPREETPSPETSNSGDAQSTASPSTNDASKASSATHQRVIDQETPTTASPRPSQESRIKAAEPTKPIPSPKLAEMQYPPKRGDSLDNKIQHTIQRKEIGSTRSPVVDTAPSTPTPPNSNSPNLNGGKPVSKSKEASQAKGVESSPPAATPQPRIDSAAGSSKPTFASPRAAPPPPPEHRHHHNRGESISTLQSEPPRAADLGVAPGVLRYSAGGDFTMEEDMARILGNDDLQNQESFLRRVSNSVRHGRSFSDKGSRMSKEHKWPRSPANGSSYGNEVGSPTSPEHRDEVAWFKNELRKERQKLSEKDQKISELETALSTTVSIKQVNTELREKRSTMVVLDAQKEIVLRELEVLTEHIAAEKKSGAPLDLGKMSNSVLREFAEAVQRLKESFAPQVEDLIQQRNDLVEEVANLARQKDKSFQEFEQLSLKNAQLADLNNQLVSQIQELYKANTAGDSNGRSAPNGLGIYSHSKDKSRTSVEGRERRPSTHDLLSNSNANIQQEEAEPATVVPGPQVVSIRKGGQAKKFNWKRGQNVAKGVTKGLKGAFSSNEQKNQRDGQFAEGQPYGSISLPHDGGASGSGSTPRSHNQDPARQGFGFFGNQKNKQPQWKAPSNDSSPALVENPTGMLLNILFMFLWRLS